MNSGKSHGTGFWAVLMAGILSCAMPASADLYGPTPYREASDSPFAGLTLDNFYLENFEDGALNTPGVTASAGLATRVLYAATYTDSVDGDDGSIDGHGNGGNSWFSSNGATGITFTFDAGAFGGALPTHAGIVWTDGLNYVTFEAFKADGTSLGTILAGPLADGSFSGGTAEDRFFGASDLGGISKIFIKSGAGAGIEVDHLQYGQLNPVPLPAALWLGAIGLSVAGWRLKRFDRGAPRAESREPLE